MTAERRSANFFRGTDHRSPMFSTPERLRELVELDTIRPSPVAGEAMSERDKLEIIERHITAFAATLPAGSLSDANKQDIRSRAMRGGSSTSAIMASVMQAVAVVKPSLQPQITNYYSGATSQPTGALDSLHGLDGRAGSRDYAGMFGISGMRGGYSGRGDYAGVGSTSGNMSSVFVSNPGSVTMINYAGTPYAAAGMTHSTFSYLRDDLRHERFSGTNILHSAQDSRTNGFSPNNRVVAKAFAVLDRDDGSRRDARNAQLGTFRDRIANDAEIIRLKAERDKATGETRAQLDAQLIARGEAISRETGTRSFLDKAPTEAAREQGRVIEMETIKKVTGAQAQVRLTVGADAAREATEAQHLQQAEASARALQTSRNGTMPATQPVLESRANELRRAASPIAEASIAADWASFNAKPTEPQTRAASTNTPPASDNGQRQVATTPSSSSDIVAIKAPSPADTGQTKSAAAGTPPAATPTQMAEAKPAAKPKGPTTTMST